MEAVKSYTDLSQSKKLAEILPIESADMYRVFENNAETRVYYGKMPTANFVCKPCWSLASLLDILPKVINNETLFIETSPALWHIGYRNIYTARTGNLVDACVAMIKKLNELKML